MDRILTVRELLALWPPGGAAKDAGVRYNAVLQWKRRNVIPAKYWQRLIHGAIARGFAVSAHDLSRLHDIDGPAPRVRGQKPIGAPGGAEAA